VLTLSHFSVNQRIWSKTSGKFNNAPLNRDGAKTQMKRDAESEAVKLALRWFFKKKQAIPHR